MDANHANSSPRWRLFLLLISRLALRLAEQQKRMGRHQLVFHDVERKAEELAKAKHNGVVRIRFQASYYDELLGTWQVACQHSKPVHDQS